MLSVALGHYYHPGFYLFTAFVGLNLFQSGLLELVPDDDHPPQGRSEGLRDRSMLTETRYGLRVRDGPGLRRGGDGGDGGAARNRGSAS